MEDFVKYVADIIEFLVGGVLIMIAIIVAFALFLPERLEAGSQALLSAPDSLSVVISLAAFAIIYGLGVIFEGISRTLVEWRLDRVTVACFKKSYPDLSSLHGTSAQESAVSVREEWRLAVEADEVGQRTIATQLSRLRVERVFLFTSVVIVVCLFIKSLLVTPFLVNPYGLGMVVMALFSYVLFRLVTVRFKRFVNSIIREYTRLHPEAAAVGRRGD